MMNPILNVEGLLHSILRTRVTEEYMPDELVQTLAGAPAFSMGAHPRSIEDVEERLTVFEEICKDVIKPALKHEGEFDVVVSEMSSALRAELIQQVDTEEAVSKWNQWADETEYLLKDYPKSFKCEAAVLLSLKAQLSETADFSQGDINGLVINLDRSTSETDVQTLCAKALAEIAPEVPVKVNSELHLLFEPIVCGQTEIRQELLTAVLRVVENLPLSKDLSVEHELLIELARYCLVKTNDSLTQAVAARLVSRMAELDPNACLSVDGVVPALCCRQNDPHPDIADTVDAALSTLHESDVSAEISMTDNICGDADLGHSSEFCEMCLSSPSNKGSTQCPSITDDCGDYGLGADGYSLDPQI